jgi:curved DNA-binding protein
MNHYETLGVNHTTLPPEIKKAYKRLASKHHPDKGGDPEQFKKVQEAWDVLGNPQKKHEYDNPPVNPFQNMGGGQPGNFGDIFGDIFGNQSRRKPNPDTKHNVQLTIEDAYNGTQFAFKAPNGDEVSVTIPAGIRDGTRLKIKGKGVVLTDQYPPGDVYLTIHLKFPTDWGRQNDDLYVKIEVDAVDAITGCEHTINHINGKKYKAKVPAGIQDGEHIKLKGLGMIHPVESKIGSLYAIIQIVIPSIKSEEILNLLNIIKEKRRGNNIGK